jgi:hypothetical protein
VSSAEPGPFEFSDASREASAARSELIGLLFLGLMAFSLGLAGSLGVWGAIAIPAGGIGAASLLRRSPRPSVSGLSSIPLLMALGVLVLAAPAAPGTDLLAGACGLGLLLWFATEPGRHPRFQETLGALLFPGLAVAVALTSSLLFPVNRDLLGVAALIVSATLLFGAWLYARLSDSSNPGAAASRAPDP